MHNNNIIKSWQGKLIRFREDGYGSLTDMAKATGKLVGHWLELKSTTEYLQALESDIVIPISELVEVVKGGIPENQGTWGHELVVTEFAAWVSVQFKLQVNKWVREIITTGKVNVTQAPQPQPSYTNPYAGMDKDLARMFITREFGNLIEEDLMNSQVLPAFAKMAKFDILGEMNPQLKDSTENWKDAIASANVEQNVELNATQVGQLLAEELGLEKIPTGAKINTALQELGYQFKFYPKSNSKKFKWKLTNKGEDYGFGKPFSNRGHSGIQIVWRVNVIDPLSDYWTINLIK